MPSFSVIKEDGMNMCYCLYVLLFDGLTILPVTAFLIVILFAVVVCRDYLRKKNKHDEERRYREQNIRTVYLTDPMLGTIAAEYDINSWELKAEHADLPAFGTLKPGVVIAEGYQERDEGIVMRSISIAYSRSRDILDKLAEAVVQELQFQDQDPETIPSVEEILNMIRITEFHFILEGEENVMQVIGGVDIDIMTLGVDALYWIDEEKWEYDAQVIGG